LPFSLEQLARAQGVRRSRPLPNIVPTKAQRDQLRGIYLQVVAAWVNGANARLLPEYRATVQDSIPEYESKEAALAHEVEVLVANLTVTGGALDVWASGVERWHRNRVISGALSAARVDLSTMLSPFDVRQTVQEAIAWNTSLIRNVSEDMRQRIANVFFAGFRAGTPPRTIGREIAEVAGIGRRRANNIAADQTTKLSAALTRARGAEMQIGEFVWRSSHKQNYRPEHLARDGKHYATSEAEAKRTGLRPPPADRAGELVFCGCTEQMWLRLEGEAVTAEQVE
jgi:uncharacterized protein with gpF-like domain